MKLSEFLAAVRYQLNDDGHEFSDGELIEYLNSVLLYLSETLASIGYRGIVKAVALDLVDGKAKLPDDFLFEEAVVSPDGVRLYSAGIGESLQKGRYSIIGDEIFAPYNSISLYYYARIPAVYELTADLPIKPEFENLVKEMVVYLALNRINVNTAFETQLATLFESKIREIASVYGWGNVPLVMPFKV